MENLKACFNESVLPSSYRKISELELNKQYKVLKVERVDTQYGVTMKFTLKEEEHLQFYIYLPKKYVDMFTDQWIEEVNKQDENLFFVYEGLYPNKSFILRLV